MSRVVLITGSSTGFGRNTAESLARSGNRVFASMRDTESRNRTHAQALRSQGIDVIDLDVTDDSSVAKAVEQVLSSAGRIDVLVNNAGFASAGVLEAFTPRQARALFEVNVFGLHRVTRAVLPNMRKNGEGLIINISSVLGRIVFPFFGIYGASKFAVEALSDSLRYEVAPLGIDVAIIQPSAYPTELFDKFPQPDDPARAVGYGTVGRIPDALTGQIGEMISGPDAPNPRDVALVIAGLIEMPRGQRPARTVVGPAFGADTINDATRPVQAGVIEALGLTQLEHGSELVELPT